jgi:hypothetical protein
VVSDALDEALAAVVAVRDCPATRRLCLDCWVWASQGRTEEEGLSYARMLLDGVRAYVAAEKRVKLFGRWGGLDDVRE